MRLPVKAVFISLLFLLLITLLAAIVTGPVPISLNELIAWMSGNADDAQASSIIELIRLPRALLAVWVGACLAMSGAAMQGLFRNPLADPSLIGVSAGASVGASLVIVFGAAFVPMQGLPGLSAITLGAFIAAVLTVALVYKLAASDPGTPVATMLLAGIAIAALAGAVNSLLEYISDSAMLRRISLWRMGGLDGADWPSVWLATLLLAPVMLLLPRYSATLNAFLLGESEARHLGVDVERAKRQLIILVALGVGACVALSGPIAFVGLIVPHSVRMLIGPDHRALLPAAALSGALLLLAADSIARVALAPAELPVGIVTAALGAPFFILLLRSRRQYGML